MSAYESRSTSRTMLPDGEGRMVYTHSFVRIKDEFGNPTPHLMCEYCDACMPAECEP